MQNQHELDKTTEIYSICRVKSVVAGNNHSCGICGKMIQKKEIVYYRTSNFQLCLACVEKSRQPNKYRINKIQSS